MQSVACRISELEARLSAATDLYHEHAARLTLLEGALADEDLMWEVVERYEECNPNEVISGYRTAIQDLLEGIE